MQRYNAQTMQHHSTRGIGIRFLIALTLPLTGVGLVIWTLVQLLIYQASQT